VDKEIQVSNNLDDNLCEDEPNEEYWKELAKEREKALNDTLEENRSPFVNSSKEMVDFFYFIKNMSKMGNV